MLPSLLARDIQQGLQQFLVTGFEPSDDFLHGLMQRFVDDKSGWLKGPYLQVGLPFTSGSAGRKFFNAFETEFPGFSHQEHAWQRLSSQHLADHTLVATGTGNLGAMPPVIGHELANDRGTVVAEAEMAWPASHLVLLTFDQSDLEAIWKNAGWNTLVLDEDAATVGEMSWTDAVCDALGIAISKKSNEGLSA